MSRLQHHLLDEQEESEFSLLGPSLTGELNETGGLMVISGPVGAGKTALLHRIVGNAVEKGAVFLGADAVRSEPPVPLEVTGKLFSAPGLPSQIAESASHLLKDALLSASLLNTLEDEAIGRAAAPFMHELTSLLLQHSESAPLVISIDDLHLADVASLRWLLYLVQRIGQARILVVVTESTTIRQPSPLLWAELLSQPECRRVQLGLFSPERVAELLALQPGLPASCEPLLCHQITGGNPRLLSALTEDYLDKPMLVPESPGSATAFGQALLTCFIRGHPMLLPLAQAIAVLDDSASPALLRELLGIGDALIVWAIDAATQAGLLQGCQFRHEQARLAVLQTIREEEHSSLHQRIAHLLYRYGAPAVAIARHKIAADQADAPWSTPVLCDAAAQALKKDDASLTLACLRLAQRSTADEAQQASIRSGIVAVKWRLDPASAQRDVSDLLHAARAGHVRGQHALALVNRLVWYGQPNEAVEILGQVSGQAPDDNAIIASRYSAERHLAFTYPAHSERIADKQVAAPELASTSGKLHILSARIISSVLAKGSSENVLEDVQTIRQQSQLSDATCETLIAALEALVLAGHINEVAFWCDELLRQAEERRVPTWYARLSAIRAMISFRQGKLAGAKRQAHAALTRVTPEGLGIYIGIALSTLVLVEVRTCHYDQAKIYLSVPVPDAMFETPVGLHYLRARGRYYLARSCTKAAVEDFRACGELMVKWGLDLPGIVPWRSDLAEANLKIGGPAKDLVLEQLTRLRPHNERTRGISLRVLAAASELEQRVAILSEAIKRLKHCGDQLELADALADLSQVYYALGDLTRARLTGRRAHQMALQCTVGGTPPLASPGAAELTASQDRDEGDSATLKLSDAELRVAALAAQGYTNRQISAKLYITVSTVEQHLTRVYKKLQVNRRADLALALPPS